MRIEINSPQGEVPEHIVGFVRDQLLAFHREDSGVSDAEVNFKRRTDKTGDEFICEIIIRLFGDTLLVHRAADSFSSAAREVIKEIRLKIDELTVKLKELPDEITTTVKL